jgi:hypothetical protein
VAFEIVEPGPFLYQVFVETIDLMQYVDELALTTLRPGTFRPASYEIRLERVIPA